jgi:AcrR family transcriptional regulator
MPAPISAKARASIDARKERRRQALKDTALRLFASQGYDATTTEEIAERAGLSWRTFFRHFPTKESVLFGGNYAWFETLAKVCRNQPSSLNDLEAVHAALMECAPTLEPRRARIRLYEKSIASSPTLRGVRQDYHLKSIKLLAETIAKRRGRRAPNEACTLAATICVLLLQQSLERWAAAPNGVGLREIITDAFEALSEVVAHPPRRAQLRIAGARTSSNAADV